MTGRYQTPTSENFTRDTAAALATETKANWFANDPDVQFVTPQVDGEVGADWIVRVMLQLHCLEVNTPIVTVLDFRDARTPPHSIYQAVQAARRSFCLGIEAGRTQSLNRMVDQLRNVIFRK